jgi:hypothetical protein
MGDGTNVKGFTVGNLRCVQRARGRIVKRFENVLPGTMRGEAVDVVLRIIDEEIVYESTQESVTDGEQGERIFQEAVRLNKYIPDERPVYERIKAALLMEPIPNEHPASLAGRRYVEIRGAILDGWP